MTGQNPSLNMTLMLALYAHDKDGATRTWVDAGYCIDAPEIFAAGSMERDEFGPAGDDWLAMPTMGERMPPNVEVTGLGAASLPQGPCGLPGSTPATSDERG